MRPPRLAIDAAAGAARLAGGALQGPWQVPAELARRALRAGASRVDVGCSQRSFRVADDGAPLDAATAAVLARALDPQAPAAARDGALAALEAGPHAELRYLAALPGARVAPVRTQARGVTIEVDGVAWGVEDARGWLRSVARFAGPRVALDGVPLPRERPPQVAEAPLEGPHGGRLWLPLTGEDGALWLVEDGIVSAFLVAPSPVAFEALLDVGAPGRASGDGAALRERVAGDVPGLVEQAARLVLRAAAEPPADPERQKRLRALLLAVARLPRFRRAALHARAYPARDGGAARRLSLVELAAPPAQGADRRIPCCAPDAAADALFPEDRPALVLDAPDRARLAQELGLRFRVLPRAQRGRAEPWSLRGVLGRLRARIAPVRSAGDLSPAERALAEALRDLRPTFAAGAGPARWHRGRLLLPRGRAEVRAAVAAVARDPACAFAAAIALAGTVGPESLRAGWRGRPAPVDSARGRTA